MPMLALEHKHLSSSLRDFLKGNPDLFARCESNGKENINGNFWCTRANVSNLEIVNRAIRADVDFSRIS